MNTQIFKAYPCDERQVPEYVLPDPLLRKDGTRIDTAAEWMNFRRGQILDLFKKYEYGEIPPRPDIMCFELLQKKDDALDGTAIRKEIRIRLAMNNGKNHCMTMLLYLPKHANGPVPAFLGLNFKGNQNTIDEPDVIPSGLNDQGQLVDPRRGVQRDRWCFREAIARGYASATICYHDIYPDRTNAEHLSIFHLFREPDEYPSIRGKYSVIGAWAWGLSRALDCLEAEPGIDAHAVAVHGQSRLGKTALWTGAVDPRFAMVIANCSGCGGAKLHRTNLGENLSQHFQYHEHDGVPVWFIGELEKYIGREEVLPVDQHELIALAAPRPVCLGTATLDFTADPKGEFLAAFHASDIYRLFGSQGLPATEMPPPDASISGDISFHYRTGKHDQTPADWACYFDAADKFLKK